MRYRPVVGSIAVYTTRRNEIVAWGVVDQLVRQNVRLHRESNEGFSNPGLLTITMDGIGDISAYHGDLFLGGLKAQTFITRESDALKSKIVSEYAFEALAPFAKAIARVLDSHDPGEGEKSWRDLVRCGYFHSSALHRVAAARDGGSFSPNPEANQRLYA